MIVLTVLSVFCAVNTSSRAMSITSQFSSQGVNKVIHRTEQVEEDSIANAIVTRADVPVSFQNDERYPWTISEDAVKNGNCGKSYSSSILTMNYSSTYKTELTFDWRCYNYSNHVALRVFVDGVQKSSTTNSSYTSLRFYIEPGQHVIVFKDSIGNSSRTENYSYIKNVKVKEIAPLESAVLTDKSQPLTFVNEGAWPWTIEDGYIQNSNYGTANSSSGISTTFEIDKPYKFSFERQVMPYNTYWSNSSWKSYQYLYTIINGEIYMTDWDNSGWDICSVVLEPGEYTIEWIDTIANTTTSYYSRIRNIELSSNWVEVELSSAGTLGVEVLYIVSVLNDVELLKVKGPINDTDWATIKQMNNLLAIDLSEAIVTSVPNNAFDGLSRLSNVKLPEGLKAVGQYAFRGTQILSIAIPSTVTNIGNMAFANTRIREVTFSENSQLTTISNGAFYNCTSLGAIVMPNTVTSVGHAAFQGCSSLKTISFSDAMTTIGDYTCSGCTALKTLHLPNNLQTIRYRSFYDTSSLLKVDMPTTVNRIYDYAFYNCGLDSLLLPVTMQYLHSYAFSNCNNLKHIELPSYLASGSDYMTYYYNGGSSSNSRTMYYGYYYNFTDCPAIETIVMRSATPPSITNDPFSNARAKSAITLKVPSFAVVNYKLDSYWYQFGSIVEGDDIDYWKITSPLSLTNNRRMQGKPDIDLYYGGQFTVGGNAPMEVGEFNIYVNESNPGRLLNTCEAMTADDINTYYSVSSETWYFFTPLHDVDLTKVTVSNNASYVFRYYDGNSRATNGTGNSWRNVDNGKLTAGQGYIFRCNKDAVLTMPTGYLKSIAPMADEVAWEGRVCYTKQSGSEWTSTTFDDSSWENQHAAWGTTDSYPSVGYDWSVENSDIYVRRIVNLTADDLSKNLWIQHINDDDFDLYINGTPVIYTGYTDKSVKNHRLSASEKQLLHVGENIIAAHCHNSGGPGYVDFGIFEKIGVSSESLARVLTTSDVTKQLTAYEAAASANKSWNYVGNPYPCYYDIYYMDFTAPITVWTGSTYKAYSIVDDNFALRPMQSFFVQKPDAVDNIVFHKEGRQLTADINHAAAVKEFRVPAQNNRHFFDLQLLDEETMDETRVVLNDEASLDYEIECDASKFMSFESAVPQMFTLDAQGNGYAINERPTDDGMVELAYYAGRAGFYTIFANRVDGEIYLYDALTNKTVNLMEQDYTFYSDVTEGPNTTRFVLSLNLGDETGINVVEKEQEDGFIYDLQGRKVQNPSKGIFIQNGHKVVRK